MINKKYLFIILAVFIMLLNTLSVPAYDCKVSGCPSEYRCMANGECTTLSVKEYCEDHGKPLYIYDENLLPRNCSEEILNGREIKLCIECQGDYELNKTVTDIELIIYGISAGIAILMIIVHGVKIVTSTDPKERENAKKGIMYVVFALIVIVITTSIIGFLIG